MRKARSKSGGQLTGGGVPIVEQFEKTDVTHAQGFESSLGLNISLRQGDLRAAMSFDTDLSCRVAPVPFSGNVFTVGFRQCVIRLHRVNCDVIPHTSYHQHLADVDYRSAETETVGTEGEIGAGLRSDTSKAKLGWFSKVIGFTLALSRRKIRKAKKTTTNRRRVAIVSPGGKDEWTVGDWELGDPRNTYGLLSGPYFEKRDVKGEPTPLCVLRHVDRARPAEITVQTTSSIWSLYVIKGATAEPVARERAMNAENTLGRRSSAAHRAHEKSLDQLRRRIAGLALGTQFRNVQIRAGLSLAPGEFLIAEQSLLIPGSAEDV